MYVDKIAMELREYAHDHYDEDGWDYLVECWDLEDIVRELTARNITTTDKAIKHIGNLLSTQDGMRREAIAEGGGCYECMSFDGHDVDCKWAESKP